MVTDGTVVNSWCGLGALLWTWFYFNDLKRTVMVIDEVLHG